jgi:hypothetical protein
VDGSGRSSGYGKERKKNTGKFEWRITTFKSFLHSQFLRSFPRKQNNLETTYLEYFFFFRELVRRVLWSADLWCKKSPCFNLEKGLRRCEVRVLSTRFILSFSTSVPKQVETMYDHLLSYVDLQQYIRYILQESSTAFVWHNFNRMSNHLYFCCPFFFNVNRIERKGKRGIFLPVGKVRSYAEQKHRRGDLIRSHSWLVCNKVKRCYWIWICPMSGYTVTSQGTRLK